MKKILFITHLIYTVFTVIILVAIQLGLIAYGDEFSNVIVTIGALVVYLLVTFVYWPLRRQKEGSFTVLKIILVIVMILIIAYYFLEDKFRINL